MVMMEPGGNPGRLSTRNQIHLCRHEVRGIGDIRMFRGCLLVLSCSFDRRRILASIFACHEAALEKSLTIQQAEDVAQDVLVSLWLRTLSPNSPPIRNRTGWIATCARNAAFRVLKSRGRELSLSESSTVRVKGPGSVDWEIDLNTAINKLCQEDQDLSGFDCCIITFGNIHSFSRRWVM